MAETDLDAMLARAGGMRHSALVSVQDSHRFWESLGLRGGKRRPGSAGHVSGGRAVH